MAQQTVRSAAAAAAGSRVLAEIEDTSLDEVSAVGYLYRLPGLCDAMRCDAMRCDTWAVGLFAFKFKLEQKLDGQLLGGGGEKKN